MKKLTFLTALLLLSLFAMKSTAQTFNPSKWMEELVRQQPDIRFSQLSIPGAHDAATWSAKTDWWEDQLHDEKTLFTKYGIRYFDCRIAFDYSNVGILTYDKYDKYGNTIGHFRHGGPGPDIIHNLKDMFTEITDHFPDSLGKECLMLDVSIEGDDEIDLSYLTDSLRNRGIDIDLSRIGSANLDRNKCRAINQFLDFVVAKYGNVFAWYKPDIKLKDLQGKILVFVNEKLAEMAQPYYKVNIMAGNDGDGYISSYNGETKTNGDKSTFIKWSTSKTGMEVDDLENKCKDKLNEYWKRTDNDNPENLICQTQLNNWHKWCGGSYYAYDDLWVSDHGDKGMNHRMYEYFKQNRGLPLGIITHDYCGVESEGLQDAFGESLDNEIICHNFVKGKFISDIRLAADKNEGRAKELLTEHNYTVIDYDLNKDCGQDTYYIYAGVKYTDNPREAIQDIIVRDDMSSNPEDTYTFDNKKYTRVKGILDNHNAFNGNTNYGSADKGETSDGSRSIIYVTKQCGVNDPTPVVDITFRESEEDIDFDVVKSYEADNDNKKDKSDLNRGVGGPFNTIQTIRMLMNLHTSDKHLYNKEYNSHDHHKKCLICNKEIDQVAHNIVYENIAPGFHREKCKDCGYKKTQVCHVPEFAYKNGFSTCPDCGKEAPQPAKQVDGVYEISNAGQLYWFNTLASAELKASAKLTSDITITDDRMWAPIGTEQKPFQGTFNGQGHTISGIKVFGDKHQGLFGYTLNATVKNLGVKDSYIKGHDMDFTSKVFPLHTEKESTVKEKSYLGSVVGYAKCSTMENLFSTAVIDNSSNSHLAGGLVGKLDESKICNSFFDGTYKSSVGTSFTKFIGIIGDKSEIKNAYVAKDKLCLGDASSVTSVTREDFESGKLCMLLNDGKSGKDAVWFQKIGKDKHPVMISNGENIIYGGYKHGADNEMKVSNDSLIVKEGYGHTLSYNADSKDVNANHDLSYNPVYDWQAAEDNQTMPKLNAKFTCTVCSNVVENEIKPVLDEVKTKKVSCTEDGSHHFVGTHKFNDNAVYTTTYEQDFKALGHDFESTNGFGCGRKDCNYKTCQEPEFVDNAYQISNAGQLYWFRTYVNSNNEHRNANAILTKDIVINKDMSLDASQLRNWKPIASYNYAYRGTFDGKCHTISGLFVNQEQYGGLFSAIDGGTVRNLGITNSLFIGDGDDHVGSFSGHAKHAYFENIFSTAKIESSGIRYGGFVGYLSVNGQNTFRNAFFNGDCVGNAIAEDFKSNSDFTNIYVPEGKYTNTNGATEVTDSLFRSGKLALLLNNGEYGKDAMWRQNVDASTPNEDGYEVDATPVLNQNHDMVVPAQYNGKDFINLHADSNGEDMRYYREIFEVSDKDDFSCPVEFAVMSAQQTRDMKGYTMGTVCLPFDIDDTVNGNIKLYKITSIDESNGKEAVLSLEEIDRLPAGTPAVFEKLDETIDTISFICSEGCTIYPAKEKEKFTSAPKYNTTSLGMMYGTYTRDSIAYNTATNIYAFRTSTNKFTRLQTGDTLLSKPFRGWIQTLSDRILQRYGIGTQNNGNGASERMKVTEDADSQLPMYDLSGRQVTNPVNGQVVIRDGKKIVYNNK